MNLSLLDDLQISYKLHALRPVFMHRKNVFNLETITPQGFSCFHTLPLVRTLYHHLFISTKIDLCFFILSTICLRYSYL